MVPQRGIRLFSSAVVEVVDEEEEVVPLPGGFVRVGGLVLVVVAYGRR